MPPEEAGLVVAGFGRHATVETASGERLRCHPRGKKNECVVGDRVAFARSGDEGVVERVEPRVNLLHRQDAWRSKAFAANVDRLLVVVAAKPSFSEELIARSLIAAHAAGIAAALVLNKRDLPEFEAARARLAAYEAMGLDVIEVALKADPEGSAAALGPLLATGATLVIGPSGAGKSTLVNRFARDADARTGEISEALQAGKHTTTATRWHWLDPDTRVAALIDSPGFQQFGLFHIEPAALASHMPDLAAHAGECRFYNCRHEEEPGCGLRAAVERGEIAARRYRIYREILGELEAQRASRHLPG